MCALDRRRPVVLLVDDDPAVTAALRRLLRREPWHVREAHSAQAALVILAEEVVDLILSDEQMPGLSGSEFLARVRRVQPETIRMILTGHASVETAIRAINDGGIRCLFLKPCDEAELIGSLRAALADRTTARPGDAPSGGASTTKSTREEEAAARQELEAEHPGITRLVRRDDGALDLDAPDADGSTCSEPDDPDHAAAR